MDKEIAALVNPHSKLRIRNSTHSNKVTNLVSATASVRQETFVFVMSNSSVGQTYDNIIEETIKASQQDFIDSGISLDYLEALRTIWKNKLANTRVATFPWANPPSPAQSTQHKLPPTTSSPSPPPAALSSQLPQSSTPSATAQNQQEIYRHNPALAALRAMQQIQQHAATQPETSNGAARVVNQLAAIAKQQDERYKQEQEMRRIKDDEERRMREDREVKHEDSPEDLFGDDEMSTGYNPSFAGSKRDISHVDSPEEANRPHPSFVAGSLLGGTPPDADSDIDAPHDPQIPQYLESSHHLITPQSTTKKKPKKEIDPLDDAINSDLDDSDIESDLDSEFGEGEEDNDGVDKSIVLCMYEKVHRTKNKWKCQLKDGVISIGGKDWVFSRANGEFEW